MNFLIQIIPWNRVDKGLLLALFGLMTFGLLFVYSATYNNELFSSATQIKQPYFKQGIFYLAGLTVAFALCLKDYNQIARWAYVFYWLNIIMLTLVLIPGIGSIRYGARRWLPRLVLSPLRGSIGRLRRDRRRCRPVCLRIQPQ